MDENNSITLDELMANHTLLYYQDYIGELHRGYAVEVIMDPEQLGDGGAWIYVKDAEYDGINTETDIHPITGKPISGFHMIKKSTEIYLEDPEDYINGNTEFWKGGVML